VFPNVVDEATFVAPSPDEGWDADQILFVGAIREVKGFDVLVRALARLAGARPQLRLLVLGAAFFRGWQRDEARARALVDELGLAPRVRFAGAAGPAEVAAAMRRSALLVVPSRRETFSAVAAEALASGTPVVATRCGGPEDFVTDETGRLTPVGDPDALAAAIDEVLRHRPSFDRTRLREHAVSRFGSAAAARRFEALYRAVLAEGPPGPRGPPRGGATT
jgi:glycosyltransferase involved in cell wall biosynthesis